MVISHVAMTPSMSPYDRLVQSSHGLNVTIRCNLTFSIVTYGHREQIPKLRWANSIEKSNRLAR